MKDQVLSIEQMKHLAELGVDISKASMCWTKIPKVDDEEERWEIGVHDIFCYELSCLNPVPTFTLQDMLEMMPKMLYYDRDSGKIVLQPVDSCKYRLALTGIPAGYMVEYADFDEDAHLTLVIEETILEAAYKMLCWLAKNELLNGHS